MDLTKQYPRSPYDKTGGYVMLGRTVDKARAKLEDTLGEYMYDCPLDQHLFEFLAIDAESLLDAVKTRLTDSVVVEWVKENQASRNEADIEAFNEKISRLGPEDVESKQYFEEIRQQVAPDLLDLDSWFDLIEADEGRLDRTE